MPCPTPLVPAEKHMWEASRRIGEGGGGCLHSKLDRRLVSGRQRRAVEVFKQEACGRSSVYKDSAMQGQEGWKRLGGFFWTEGRFVGRAVKILG